MSTENKVDFMESKKTKEYKSFPDGGISNVDYRALRGDERFEGVHPIAGYVGKDCITHIGFTYAEHERMVGWNPQEEKWLEIVKFKRNFESNEAIDFEIAHPFDDETEEPIIEFTDYLENENFSVDGLYNYIEDYISHTYDNPPAVFYFMKK